MRVNRGAENWVKLEGYDAEWFIAENLSKVKELKKHPRKNKEPLKLDYLKASLRAAVEHPFRIIKCQFGFIKACYRGLKKNDNKLATMFALANIIKIDKLKRAAQG